MPLDCFGLHNWTDPFIERVKVDRLTRFPLTRLHKIQRCMACGKTREVYENEQPSGRIQTFETD